MQFGRLFVCATANLSGYQSYVTRVGSLLRVVKKNTFVMCEKVMCGQATPRRSECVCTAHYTKRKESKLSIRTPQKEKNNRSIVRLHIHIHRRKQQKHYRNLLPSEEVQCGVDISRLEVE